MSTKTILWERVPTQHRLQKLRMLSWVDGGVVVALSIFALLCANRCEFVSHYCHAIFLVFVLSVHFFILKKILFFSFPRHSDVLKKFLNRKEECL